MKTMTLQEAAQAVVDRWDSPLWKDLPHTGECINALRAALADHAKAQAEPKRPLFAAAVAHRKWDDLQAKGHRMKSIAFDGGPGGAGTIDPWGVVRWGGNSQAQAEPVAHVPEAGFGNTRGLIQQLHDALQDARDDVLTELVNCQTRAGYPQGNRRLAAQQDLAAHVTSAINAAAEWLQQPAQPERQPLTERAILALMPTTIPASMAGELLWFARAVERAHGIGKGE